MREGILAGTLVLLMLLQVQVPVDSLEPPSQIKNISIGESEYIVVGTPGGYNTQLDFEVPSGEVLTGLEMEFNPRPLLRSSGFTWSEEADFSTNGVILDSIDYNLTEGFSILPNGGSWDFESGSIPSDMSTGGHAQWSITNSSPLGGTYMAQSGRILHNQESTLTLSISNIAGSGSFKYRVSSESNYDYLVFCIDNTGCSRYSGYTSRWSGYSSSTYNFQTSSSTQTLTWKYAKDGSVNSGSDAAWIDDIEITPAQGTGNGMGNWTSQVFGTGVQGANHLSFGPMGMMSIDADIPADSLFMWSLLDADTMQPIPGFRERSELNFDLGLLDESKYDRLQLYLQLGSGSSGSPLIKSINFGGRVIDSFGQNPSESGWQLGGMTHSNGVVSGSGTLVSPLYSPVGGVAGFEYDLSASGTVQSEYSLNGEDWYSIEDQSSLIFSTLHQSIQFRMICSQASIDAMDLLLPTSNMPKQMAIDIGMDGLAEFGIPNDGMGSLGLQNQFDDGTSSAQISTSSSAEGADVLLPRNLTSFRMSLYPLGPSIDDAELIISHGNHELLSKDLGMIADLATIELSEQDLSSLATALNSRNAEKSAYDLDWYHIALKVESASSHNVLLSGLNAFWDAEQEVSFGKSSPLVRALSSSNEQVMPIKMNSPGSVYVKLVGLQSTQTVDIIGLNLVNSTEPLTASQEWLESSATFDFNTVSTSNPLVTGISEGWRVRLDLIGSSASASVTCDLRESESGQSMSSFCEQEGIPLDWSEGGISASSSGSLLSVDHRFRLPASWDDEPRLNLEVRIDVGNHLTPAASLVIGKGPLKGIENDIRIISWTAMSENGIESSQKTPAISPGSRAFAIVDLGFEGMPDDLYPRSGDVQVEFFLDDKSIGTTTDLTNGRASIAFDTPTLRPHIDLELEIKGLKGQQVFNESSLERRFKTDSLIPELLSTSAHRFDTSNPSSEDFYSFMISDAPYLPQYANAIIQRDWRGEEWTQHPLALAKKHGDSTGEYHLIINNSDAPDGGLMNIYLEVHDAAGNQMLDSGNSSIPLHTIFFTAEGNPILSDATISGASGIWLHPETPYRFTIDLEDGDGVSDIAMVQIDLSSGSGENLLLKWDNHGTCDSTSDWINVLNCSISSLGEVDDPFSPNSRVVFDYEIEWGFNSDTSMLRIPAITIKDRSGQVEIAIREDLNWRYSTEVEVDPSTIKVSLEEQTLSGEGVFLPPSTSVEVSGNVRWTRDGSPVDALLSTRIILGEEESTGISDSNGFVITVDTPSISGNHPLLARLESLPFTAVDRSQQLPILWIVVDAEQPSVRTLISPSAGDVIRESSFDDLRIEVSIEEHERLDLESMRLHWEVKRSDVGIGAPVIFGGEEALLSIGGRSSGSSIPMGAQIPLGEKIDDSLHTAALTLSVYITGNDVSGQQISDIANNQSSPLAVWQIEQDQPFYSIPLDGVTISKKGTIIIGDNIDTSIEIFNEGKADGIAKVMVTAVDSDGIRRIIGIEDIFIPANQSKEHLIIWEIENQGANWLEIEITGQQMERSPVIVAESPSVDGILSSATSEMNPVLLSVFILITISLISAILLTARRRVED